jgi:hypothetical protein
MGFYATRWLREARDNINAYSEQVAGTNPSGGGEFEKVARAVENSIKAALIERHGSIPQDCDHKRFVAICQTTGVWEVLPPVLRNLVQEVESYRTGTPCDMRGSTGSSPEQLQKYSFIARRLIDYMEDHVIGNDSVLKRLKVA